MIEVNSKINILKMMAHPVRLRLLDSLNEHGESNVMTLQERLDLSQSTVSQHLAKLRDGKMIKARREQTKIFYEISNPLIPGILSALKELDVRK